MDPVTGSSVYRGFESKIAPGVMFSQSAALIPDDPTSEQPAHIAGAIVKFRNTTDSPIPVKYYFYVANQITQDINDLKFNLITTDTELDPIDGLYDSKSFVSAAEFESAGHIEVIHETADLGSGLYAPAAVSTGFIVVVSLILAAFSAQHVALVTDKSTVFNVPPLCVPSEIVNKTKGEKLAWINQWMSKYCETLKKSAKANNIPPRLLSAVILNELADFDAFDQTQMILCERDEGSYGWIQLQISRVLDEHKLVDIGTRDQVRDPDIDITESEIKAEQEVGDAYYQTRGSAIRNLMWRRLVNPDTAIEIAAREVAYILNKFQKGRPELDSAWAKALLKNPSEGIDRNNIYANLKTEKTVTDPIEHQKNLEESLAILVVGPYNSPNIVNERDPVKVQLDNKTPWQDPPIGDKYFFNARQHAVNVKSTALAKMIYEWLCLKDVVANVPRLKSFAFSETILRIWNGEVSEIESESISGPSDDIQGYRPSADSVVFEVSGQSVCEKIVSYAHKIEHMGDATFREFIGRPVCKTNSTLYISLNGYNTSSPTVTLSFDFYGQYKWSDGTIWNDSLTAYNLKRSPRKDVVVNNNVYTATWDEDQEITYGDASTGSISITVEFP